MCFSEHRSGLLSGKGGMRGDKRARNDSHAARSTLGRTLRSWRKARALPLKAIATDLGVSIETVSAWEAGERFPTPERLDKLADYMGITVCRLFCRQTAACAAACREESDSGLS